MASPTAAVDIPSPAGQAPGVRTPVADLTRLAARLLVLLAVSLVAVPAQEADGRRDGPDWIPVGAVPPEVERRAMETRARLESRSPPLQRAALTAIRSDIDDWGRGAMRTAAVPLVVDLLSQEYRILETPRDYRVDADTRLQALGVLAELGGETARRQLRATIATDDDPAVRAAAGQYLASVPGGSPQEDFRAIARGIAASHRRGGPEGELYRLLRAAERMAEIVWDPEDPVLLEALVGIAGGSYSSSVRTRAMSFLESLSER